MKSFRAFLTEDDTSEGARKMIAKLRTIGLPWGAGNAHTAKVTLGHHVRVHLETDAVVGENLLVISSIESERPGKGYGTEALRRICELADEFKVDLALEAMPFTPREGKPIPVGKLKAFYASFGFRTERSEDLGDAYMFRRQRRK